MLTRDGDQLVVRWVLHHVWLGNDAHRNSNWFAAHRRNGRQPVPLRSLTPCLR